MEGLGRPLENNMGTDNMEVVRRMETEQKGDLNYLVANTKGKYKNFNANEPGNIDDVPDGEKMPYIKGDVY